MNGPDLLRAFLRDLDRVYRDVAEFDARRDAVDPEEQAARLLDPLLDGLDLVDHGDLVDIDPDTLSAPACDCGRTFDLDGVCLECDALDTWED